MAKKLIKLMKKEERNKVIAVVGAGHSEGLLQDIKSAIGIFDNSLSRVDKSIKDDFQRNREESNKIAKENRDELTNSLKLFSDTFSSNVK